ncbi:MAG: NADH-quinone oxidoreductase subunit N, partial [Acidimicrobiales bacterium]
WLIAVLTLLVGSVLAIAQRDLKRMLAYSSISQAGYVLVGVQAASSRGQAAAMFYVFTYVFIIAGSFAVVSVLQGRGEARTDLGAVRGLSRRRPLLAGAMLVFLLAQAGVPLTSGFLGKFFVVEAVVQRGNYALAVIAMLAAAIAAFFYLRIALLMYWRADETPPVGAVDEGPFVAGLAPVPSLDGEPGGTAIAVHEVLEAPPAETEPVPLAVGIGLWVCVLFTILAGVGPWVIDYARQATSLF